jgi:FAD/FMN-containing dehydrogenase
MRKPFYLIYNLLKKLITVLLTAILILTKRTIAFIHRHKVLTVFFYGFIIYLAAVIIIVKTSGDKAFSTVLTNKCINDVTAINPVQVNQIIHPQTVDEIASAIKNSSGKISIGGGKFSMGGQTAFENSLHIDMRSFNKILDLDTIKKQITVEPGITWREIQKVIDPNNLSIKIMQTYANFTVGGSVSVNCHGRYIGHGPIVSSVLELKIVTASGDIITANRNENADVFKSAIGGYGGIGVITSVTLQLVDNTKVERHNKLVEVENYNDYFIKNIRDNEDVVFQNGDLYPPNYTTINSVFWKKSLKVLTDTERITPADEPYWLEPKLLEFVSWGSFGKWIRRVIVDPIVFSSEKVVWRNKEASYDVKELEPSSREKSTYVLQEYFIPVENINSFIPKMRNVFKRHKVNVLNVSLRHALPDNETFLSWANKEVFAFVVYYKQGTDEAARKKVKQWTLEMTDAILSEQGTWYLPYQPHATVAQFQKGFPNSDKYFAVKNSVDSNHRFNNKLLDKYNPFLSGNIEHARNNIEGYYRAEEQTVLTVPEWYLVFNPKEYADYLESGKNPSGFPFYKSIKEYWKLYDRSLKLVSQAYPENEEYKTMLQVIGVSSTMEYVAKTAYENTIGRFFNLFQEEEISEKEKVIIEAQRAYSDFVYHTAWYEFKFFPWVKKIFNTTDTSPCSFLRKWERTFFFTAEFSFKALYALLIEKAAKASYEAPVPDIYILVETNDAIQESKNLKIVKEQGDKKVIAVTRWGAFTETLQEIAEKDISIKEIGGNDEIAVSVVLKKNQQLSFSNAQVLYESEIVTDESLKRLVCLLPVNELLKFIRYAKSDKIFVEHLYDY